MKPQAWAADGAHLADCLSRCFKFIAFQALADGEGYFGDKDWWAAGEDSIKHLLSRGTHREFGYVALVVMLVFYFAGAVWAAGSAIASGLFVPMLLIGSCIGRIVGLMAVDFAAAGGHGSDG